MPDSISDCGATEASFTTQADRSHRWKQCYLNRRRFSEQIAAPLSPEDCAIQSMPDVSPTRWHLAHTTWFFETFLLRNRPGYQQFNPAYECLFNSYYNAVGQPYPRHRRGQLSRPGLAEVLEYRHHVDGAVVERLESGELEQADFEVLQLGLQHEQQHQELMLTDIKHVFFCNPLRPSYQASPNRFPAAAAAKLQWRPAPSGVFEVGYRGCEFAYDNESPRHPTYLQPHQLASRCVTNGEYLEFVLDDGYSRPEWWLSLGWAQLAEHHWQAPLYWIRGQDGWHEFTLAGTLPLQLDLPVCHISYFEADAFARWSGNRLPTEFEWEVAASSEALKGVFADQLFEAREPIHPQLQCDPSPLSGMFGNVWEWTSSHYSPYPGYRAAAGALGEYNGKFMCNQFVLRGGSCATSSNHIRPTYRNFFSPETRWQFSGIRLARD